MPPEDHWRTDDAILCLECGRWLKALGRHLPSHDLDSATYRAVWGMGRQQSLASRDYGAARREIAIVTGGPERLTAWAPIVEAARIAASREATKDRRPLPEARRTRAAADAHHRKVREREDRARQWLAEAGCRDPAEWLRARSDEGWSVRAITRELDLSETSVLRWMDAAGIPRRPPGPRPDPNRRPRRPEAGMTKSPPPTLRRG
ncbi:MAG: MucR family transcriptional regulator [Georgenia sp.]